MDQLLNTNGILPWMPASLSQEEQEEWMKGWEFEAKYFDEDENIVLPPSHLPHIVRHNRTAVLQHLIDLQQPDIITIEQQAAAIDILLGSAADQPDQWLPTLDTVNHAFQSMQTLVLENIQTPYTWFHRYIKQLPDELLFEVTDVNEIFVAVALDGRVANHRPSVVAAAILAFLLGDDQVAEPYLCGYDMFDIWMVKSHIENIVQETAGATNIEY